MVRAEFRNELIICMTFLVRISKEQAPAGATSPAGGLVGSASSTVANAPFPIRVLFGAWNRLQAKRRNEPRNKQQDTG
jgi:hypothetical protein